jgi:DNA ligase (NAD+)
MPKHCPICGSEAVREEGEVASRCTGIACPAKRREALLHFASRQGMDIQGLGEALVDQLLAKGLVEDVADIFGLEAGALAELSRMGKKSAANVVAEIEAAKARPLHPAALLSGNPARRRACGARPRLLVRLHRRSGEKRRVNLSR